MANEYKSFYLKDLMDMIDRATVEVIRMGGQEKDGLADCPLRARLQGILDLADELKCHLNDGEG